MKVVIVHTDFRIYWPSRLNALTGYLKEREIDLDIVEIAGTGSPYNFSALNVRHADNWHCLFPDRKIEELPAGYAKHSVMKKLDELMPDVLISGPIAFPSGAASVTWAVRNRRKLIVFDDARLVDVPRPWWIDYIRKKVYSCVDAVFCPSPEWINTFKHFGFKSEQLFYGVDVVDNNFWKTSDNLPGLFPSGTRYFLTIGRQVRKKNFLFLLNSYRNFVKNTNDPFHLVMVGEGPENEQLRAFVLENHLVEHVHFYPFMTQEQLRAVYQYASWFILPSSYGETWGLVVNEAMACSLPVIVSDQVGCTKTLVKNGFNGFTFSPERNVDLTDIFIRVNNLTEDERIKMGRRSLEVISEWDLERFCKGMFDALRYVSGKSGIKPGLISKLIISLWTGRYRPV